MISKETINKIESTAGQQNLTALKAALSTFRIEMEDEGFDRGDITSYLEAIIQLGQV